jgi:cobalt-zinc-cadmium efflux system outer membrane protein
MLIFRPSCALARLLTACLLATLSLTCGPCVALAQAPSPTLTLTDAVRRALAADPSTAAAEARMEAARAAGRQAGLRPNPSIGVELENFGGSGAYSILDRTEATVSYQQTFERGGKGGPPPLGDPISMLVHGGF